MFDQKLVSFLNRKVEEYNQPDFIKDDPVCIPHLFNKKQDIEIAGFFAAIMAWGNRTTIINKSKQLMEMMDYAPHDFCLNAQKSDLEKLLAFKHRTFNPTDILYFVEFLNFHYQQHTSLENAFTQWMQPNDEHVENALAGFYTYVFCLEDAPQRTRKHIATPYKKSTCKRLNMYLRWMVRKDNNGVDFGIWEKIASAQLICPVDVHVARVTQRFQLTSRTRTDWLTAVELTKNLKTICEDDPVKYDFALFALGVIEKF